LQESNNERLNYHENQTKIHNRWNCAKF